MTNKLTRRQFLATAALAAAGALVAGVVKVEPAPVEDVGVVPVEYTDTCTVDTGEWDFLFENPSVHVYDFGCMTEHIRVQ